MTVVLNKIGVCISIIMASCLSMQVQAATEGLPAVDARFETIKCAMPCKEAAETEWWMMRTPSTVEVRHVDAQTGELSKRGEMWKYSPNGKSTYLFMMHEDKRAIEYLFDDLKILGLGIDERRWQINTQLLTNEELASFEKAKGKSEAYQGYETEVYNGMIGKAQVRVLWLPALKLPAKLEYVYPTSTTTIKLKTLAANEKLQAENTVPRTTEAQLATYHHVYYTDIGDMEENPEAQTWIAKAAGAPGLHAHQH
jgi:hypothetical protein